jgi:hypothetical protein
MMMIVIRMLGSSKLEVPVFGGGELELGRQQDFRKNFMVVL